MGRANLEAMADANHVDTIARLAQWTFESLEPCAHPTHYYRRSDPFKMGIWSWYLTVEINGCFFPNRLQFARINHRLSVSSYMSWLPINHSSPLQVQSREIVSNKRRRICLPGGGYGLIARWLRRSQFLDLKIFNGGGDGSSMWASMRNRSTQTSLKCLSRMLNESIHSDVTINTADGELRAHRAVLSSRSSLLLEKEEEEISTTIDMEDMTSECCMALLSYLYGGVSAAEEEEERLFRKHRMALLGAAHKYGIAYLKEACEESLLEDISTENVLERLREGWVYGLEKLWKGCLSYLYLYDFGKIHRIQGEFDSFFEQTDRKLQAEMIHKAIDVHKSISRKRKTYEGHGRVY